MKEKAELLDEVDELLVPNRKLGYKYLFFILLIMSFIGATLFPKIYITQQIYFKSRDIAKLKREYDTLKEENKLISASVESIRFKNQILDTLF